MAANPLNDRGIDGAEHEQEEPPLAADIPQRKGDDQPADAIQDAERPAYNAAVLVLAAHGGGEHDLADPAQERVGKKQKNDLIKCHTECSSRSRLLNTHPQ